MGGFGLVNTAHEAAVLVQITVRDRLEAPDDWLSGLCKTDNY